MTFHNMTGGGDVMTTSASEMHTRSWPSDQ